MIREQRPYRPGTVQKSRPDQPIDDFAPYSVNQLMEMFFWVIMSSLTRTYQEQEMMISCEIMANKSRYSFDAWEHIEPGTREVLLNAVRKAHKLVKETRNDPSIHAPSRPSPNEYAAAGVVAWSAARSPSAMPTY